LKEILKNKKLIISTTQSFLKFSSFLLFKAEITERFQLGARTARKFKAIEIHSCTEKFP
jgi:hypothetical protein